MGYDKTSDNPNKYFRCRKEAARYKAACDAEKRFLSPLLDAEQVVKKTMTTYVMEQNEKRKALEEELRRKAEAESAAALAKAVEHENEGNTAAAQDALLEAQVLDSAARSAALKVERPKASGASLGTDWEIVAVDQPSVPITFSGVEIRPVDMAAINRLIRASKGTIQIPGITYKAVPKMSIRR